MEEIDKVSKNISPRPESEADIDEFLKRVQLVRESSYFQNTQPVGDLFKLSFIEGMETSMHSPPPKASRESIESFIMRMRPLIVYEEELYVGKVCTFIFEGKGEFFEERLATYRKIIKYKRTRKVFSLNVAGQTFQMSDMVWLYLYGEFFHLERKKRKAIQDLDSVFQNFTINIALSELEWWAGLALSIAGDINLMRKGHIKLPPLPYKI